MIDCLKTYYDRIEKARQTVATDIPGLIETNALYEKELLYCSTNKRNFLPDNPATDKAFFTEIHFNKRLRSIEDQTAMKVLSAVSSMEGDRRFVNTSGPYIFCAFHFGPFFQIGPTLHRLGYKLSVLTEGGITHRMLRHDATAEDLSLYHSNTANVLLSMISNLQKGKSTLAFLDGNRGVAQDQQRKSYVTLKFLGHTFYCKKGIPHMAYVTKTPIIPVISYRDAAYRRIKLRFGSPIIPKQGMSREAFVANAVQQCYDEFAHYLVQQPAQWAEWHSLHDYMDLSDLAPRVARRPKQRRFQQVKFNQFRYHVYRQNSTHYLFDKDTYASFSISRALSGCLQSLKHYRDRSELINQVPARLMTELLNKEILIGN